MLKDLFSLLTIIALLFSSCSKSDEEENGDEPQPTKQLISELTCQELNLGMYIRGEMVLTLVIPQKKTWITLKPKVFIWYVFHFVGNAYNPQ